MNSRRLLLVGMLLLLPSAPLSAAEPDSRSLEFFEKKIRPVLVEQCYSCHSEQARKAGKLKGGLLLDSPAGIRKGGDSGASFVAGKPADSILIKALRYEEPRMPPRGQLPETVLADFAAWVDMGAPLPPERPALAAKSLDWDKAREFWAFQPPTKHAPPQVHNTIWPKKDSDFFLLAELEKRQLQPVRPADKRELLRRASFDLIGLPPTPEEVDAFLHDNSPDAFAKVVDRLLASPHYGERWGRYWLDVARYSDDKALAIAKPFPHAYRYRDWVVQAFNQDMPYDQFLRLQLAGDLVPAQGVDPFTRLAGLGFQGLGAEYHKGNFTAQVMADELDDRVDTLTRGLLGLTVACARCHDHKYDPIPTRDYYSLAAAYQGATMSEIPIASPETAAHYSAWEKEHKDQEASLKKPGNLLDSTVRAQLVERKARLEQHRKAAPPMPMMVHGVQGGGQALRVQVRGRVDNLGEDAPPGFLRILRLKADGDSPGSHFTRLDLAEAIATPRNPLTARVFVNRIWQHHFGRGIVATTNNFGKLGERPTHPELLDTLAVRFTEAGWSTKWLHREIMLSAAYQLSSANDPNNASRDPENQYLWRMAPARLDVEAWRDSLLAVSGRLDRTVGGPGLDLGIPHKSGPKNVRRTVYALVSRSVPDAMLTTFDFPDANVSSDRRSVTTVPQQQLFALNSDFMTDTAQAFAARLEKASPTPNESERIVLAYRFAFGRAPTPAEQKLGHAFLEAAAAGRSPQDKLSPWEQYAQALLASNEFAWVD